LVFEDLQSFAAALEAAGQLKRVKAEVDVNLEMAEILRRVMYDRGPAVLFEKVKGYRMPVLGNAFGSLDRMRMALGTEKFEELGTRMTDILRMEIPTGFLDKIRSISVLRELSNYAPKLVKGGPVMDVVETDKPSLSFLPAMKTWPKDAGRFITFGLVVTKNPENGVRNVGVYRMQLFDDTSAAMHWQIHKRGAQHLKTLVRMGGDKIQVAVVIGCDPAVVYSGVAPVPEGLDKYLFTGIMRAKGVELVKCRTVDLEVPANSEIVLEGYVDPSDLRLEGPFGDHTGYYTPPELFPTFHLTGIMHRKNPIYLTTVVGKPVLEDAYLGKVVERSFLPLIQVFHPEVVDFNMPASGWFQGLVIVSIKKTYPGQARKVMMGLWGLGQLMLTKMIIAVDSDINVHSIDDVIWAVTTRVDPARDVMILDNVPTDTLDPASKLVNLGSKLGLDATVKGKDEGMERGWQELEVVDEETKKLVDSRWQEYSLA
jgi:4-hydroxy-3-polyprenylbenzoate decarboxylase